MSTTLNKETSRDPLLSSDVPWHIRLLATRIRRLAIDWILYKNHTDVKKRKIGIDAGKWILSDEETGDLTTFVDLCDAINLDYQLVRSKIINLTEEDARKLRGMEYGDN